MNKKNIETVVTAALVLGVIAGTVCVRHASSKAKPRVSIDINDITDGEEGGIEFDYSWQNVPDSSYDFRYFIEKDRTLIAEVTFPAALPSYSPPESLILFIPYLSQGKYKITAQLMTDGKIVSKDSDTFALR